MSFKENYNEYKNKVDTWFSNHSCSEKDCSLYKYHSCSDTACNIDACNLIALRYINEIADIIEDWYEDFKFEHAPRTRFYNMLGISILDNEKPWQKYSSGIFCEAVCTKDMPCFNCPWWEEGFIK